MRYWLAFDIGLGNDIRKLYTWLDTVGAKECGESLATFTSDVTPDALTKELIKIVGMHSDMRLYLINRHPDKRIEGRFILGRRRQAPWTGYAAKESEVDLEDSGE